MDERAYKACGDVVSAIAGLSRQQVTWALQQAKECHDRCVNTDSHEEVEDEYIGLARAIRYLRMTKQQHLLVAAYYVESFLGEASWTTPDLVQLLKETQIDIEPTGTSMHCLVSQGLVKTVRQESRKIVFRSLTQDGGKLAKDLFERGSRLAPGEFELSLQY